MLPMNPMSNQITIGTWNLCLGLPNKKDIAVDILELNKVNICCLPNNFPESVLNCGGYKLELESNSGKKTAGIYIKKEINYTRRLDLKLNNMHVVILDVLSVVQFRIINIYRSFRPPGGITVDKFFEKQLEIIKMRFVKTVMSSVILTWILECPIGLTIQISIHLKKLITLLTPKI